MSAVTRPTPPTGHSGLTPSAIAKRSWCAPARHSPSTAPLRHLKTSPTGPASASARCTGTSPPAMPSSKRPTGTASSSCAMPRTNSSPSKPPDLALELWMLDFVGYVATKRGLAATLKLSADDSHTRAVRLRA